MAGPLTAVERFFERLFERPAARLFQARVETVQIQRALERVMESERVVQARRSYAPSVFRVLLNAADMATLPSDRVSLPAELGEGLRQYARARSYTMLARPRVEIEVSAHVPEGDIRAFADKPVVPAAESGSTDGRRSPADFVAAHPAPTFLPEAGQQTQVFAAAQPSTPRAVLVVRSSTQGIGRFPVSAGTTRIGRAPENDIVLIDDRVSRRHGQIATRFGMLVYTDLGSTNGSFLNGSPVTEIALGPTDLLQVGSSTITIEPTL
ncbi:MAG TPA: DUF3662 and FHA domain-containing protein [Candidatus Limnocylindrales bacterium]|nr:DUF3662 and FHA domain-containing protein [Candidatus Limnocylindrales bacterium]